MLQKALFQENSITKLFDRARQKAQGQLRFLVSIEEKSASELHALRWEMLADPLVDDALLATNLNLPFSRFLASDDWRDVTLRNKAQPSSPEKSVPSVTTWPPSRKVAVILNKGWTHSAPSGHRTLACGLPFGNVATVYVPPALRTKTERDWPIRSK